MHLLVLLFPLIGFIGSGAFGHRLGREGSSIFTTFLTAGSCFLSYYLFYVVGVLGYSCTIPLSPWMDSGEFSINWGFCFDSLTVTMLVVVTTVSSLVHLYSMEYMKGDPSLPRFMSYLSLFTFFMLVLVTADNFAQMFLGWEGVGICSYLLINFWHTRVEANKAAIKAILVNKVGDFGLLIGMVLIFFTFNSLNFSTVFACAPIISTKGFYILGVSCSVIDAVCLLLFVGCVGKSAQIGLHTWLPDAMEGPTPVSALIHAATMVTAGVYLLLRCSPLFEYSPYVLGIVAVFGAMTAFFAATVGLVQHDLKKVIAYSTCSQLGYMVFACGLSHYSVSMFHLMNHAFFKALLFLGAGSVIHALSDEQDMRKMGGLVQILPYTYTMMLIASLSLMGLPFLTGFYSKDVILELSYSSYTVPGYFSHWLGCISAFFTSFYSIRLLYLSFLARTNSYRRVIEIAHDAPFLMAIPLGILCVGSIFVGYVFKDMMIGLGTDFWGNSLMTLKNRNVLIESEFIPTYIKLLPVILSLIGATAAWITYNHLSRFISLQSMRYRDAYTFFSKKFYFDGIYNNFIVYPLMFLGYHVTFKTLDRGLIEVFGPFGLSTTVSRLSKRFQKLQSGYVYNYAFSIILGAALLLAAISLPETILTFVGFKLVVLLVISVFFYQHYLRMPSNT